MKIVEVWSKGNYAIIDNPFRRRWEVVKRGEGFSVIVAIIGDMYGFDKAVEEAERRVGMEPSSDD